jgi:hypothetical protein
MDVEYRRWKPERLRRMRNWLRYGSLLGMSNADRVFRWTIGLSLLVHGVAFGSVWGSVGRYPRATNLHLPQDSWVGTTVSVYEEPPGDSVPASQESKELKGASSKESEPVDKTPARHVAPPKASRTLTRAPVEPSALVEKHPLAAQASPNAAAPNEDSRKASSAGAGTLDLRQAMLDASNQKASGSGTFGAVGVDLRERRLPAAFTRALPVAIGAEAGWWRHHTGLLGKVRFEVALNEAGKIEEVSINDEAKHALLAAIVRRVGRLLAVGRYALPASSTPNARQGFELTLELQDGVPSSNETAEAGDAVDMGWQAPASNAPGLAHIQEARGRRMLAKLRVLPSVREGNATPEETPPGSN